jgi:hypothetical protein
MERGKVEIASDVTLRNREISPFVVDMENNGRLSRSGIFRTQPSDVEALVGFHLSEARKKWGLKAADPTDVAIYAHGGLTGEDAAANTAARWIPALYEQRIFPIFLMWETDLWSTLKNRLEDIAAGLPRATGGLVDQIQRYWNQRLERALAPAGTAIWAEMKQNADALTYYDPSLKRDDAKTGGQLLYEYASKSEPFTASPVRLHLIGHSAGAIVHCHAVDRLATLGWKFESVSFLAAAARMDLFKRTVLPRVQDRTVRQFRSFHLTDTAEEQDPTCRPILYYGRSLLYLVSESFEGGTRTPLVGMDTYFQAEIASLRLPGGFDDDRTTIASVITLIKGGKP